MASAASDRISTNTCRVFIICLPVIIFLYLLYYAVPQSKIIFLIRPSLHENFTAKTTNVSSITVRASFISCELSLNESDGWFCEGDDDWKRRKQLHHRQDKLNRHSNSAHLFFQNNWEPTIQCEFEQRIGNVGDGGKWVCDVYHLQRGNYIPLIYSFGSNDDFSFEREIKRILPKAEIHTFDRGFFACPIDVCTFHQATIGDGTIGTKSLNMIIDELGHRQRQIDILKIDIEGGEYAAFDAFFRQSQNIKSNNTGKQNVTDAPYIRQILVEIHTPGGEGDRPFIRVHELFELFRQNNYAIFHKEANLYAPSTVFEYALIRLNRAFLFHHPKRWKLFCFFYRIYGFIIFNEKGLARKYVCSPGTADLFEKKEKSSKSQIISTKKL